MSRWDGFDWSAKAPKKPPPAHGIKVDMKKTGTTWWGQRWLEALERMSRGYASRLARGRSYARAGRTHDLTVLAGKVSAKVTGSRAKPYDITLRLTPLGELAWAKAIAAMAERAQFAAALLAGEMPKDIDEAFQSAGASLFPVKEADLVTACSCPDWANPCKHVAATHYVLGEAFDRDPFLLFELRGRTRAQLLDALRAARARAASDAVPDMAPGEHDGEGAGAASQIPTVTLGAMTAADYERPRAALPKLQLSFAKPSLNGALLRQLGAPASWHDAAVPAELLAPMVQKAAERARQIALAEVTSVPETTTPELDETKRDRAAPARARPTKAKTNGPSSRRRSRD